MNLCFNPSILQETQDDPEPTQREEVVLAATVIRYTITGVLFPLFDIGSDLAAAYTHFKVSLRNFIRLNEHVSKE